MIDLPDYPAPNGATPVYLDKGGITRGGLGAPDQRVNRLGGRFGLAVTMPVLPSAKLGRKWVARLIRAQEEGARMEWPQLDFDVGEPGTVRINGAGQAGSTLAVDGASPGYAFREGQFFSIITGGAHHIYMVTTETLANGSGQASLPIWPPLRVQHADNDLCEFRKPLIEGFVQGDVAQWELQLGNFIGLQFEIYERA